MKEIIMYNWLIKIILTYFILVCLLLMSGCTSSTSKNSDYSEYKNDSHKLSIQYPINWIKEEELESIAFPWTTNLVSFYPPVVNQYTAPICKFNIGYTKVGFENNNPMNLNDSFYFNIVRPFEMGPYFSNKTHTDKIYTSVAGYPAISMNYGILIDNNQINGTLIYLIKNDSNTIEPEAIILDYWTIEETNVSCSENAKHMINSFKFF